ncbi:hypothetical protein ANN_24326 [Periplaneta americana]|uniref:DUF4817 domain-containing protein n=1 Tax=Periplaneta americana TaxID=6978 RepID=A0ABQ8S2T9_PERAM|nr:hypothetical protein ANN_24326 [Periplaneta americana]
MRRQRLQFSLTLLTIGVFCQQESLPKVRHGGLSTLHPRRDEICQDATVKLELPEKGPVLLELRACPIPPLRIVFLTAPHSAGPGGHLLRLLHLVPDVQKPYAALRTDFQGFCDDGTYKLSVVKNTDLPQLKEVLTVDSSITGLRLEKCHFSDQVIDSNSNDSTALIYCMNGHRYDERFVRRIINKSVCRTEARMSKLSKPLESKLQAYVSEFGAHVFQPMEQFCYVRSLPSKETLRGHSDSSFRGEGYIQCCVGVRLCDMYSNQELAEIHFMYGKADGNAALACRLYQERYPQRQCPGRKTFVRLHYRLCEYRKFNSPGLGRGRPRSTSPGGDSGGCEHEG